MNQLTCCKKSSWVSELDLRRANKVRTGRLADGLDASASGSAPVATLAVLAPLGSGEATVYARLGDAFGWLCAIASAAAWLASLREGRPVASILIGGHP